MATTIRFKRRATGGASGAPSALKTSEPAYNEVDGTLYLGVGDDGSANATSIVPIAGKGAFVDLSSAQTITGAKTFGTSPTAPTPAAGDNSTKVATTAYIQAAGYAPLASPGFTGTPTAPTAAADTNTGQLATAAFVLGQAATATPSANGSAAVGTSTRFARQDHVHPTDTTRAALASPAFTGTPTAPTATSGTNTTQLATTAFVLGTRLDQLAAPTGSVSFGGQRATNAADAVASNDLVTLQQLQTYAQGQDPKASVRLAVTTSDSLSGLAARDDITPNPGDRIAALGNGAAAGIYIAASGPWTRATDFDTSAKVTPGATFYVEEGTANGRKSYILITPAPITLGTTSLTFTTNGSGTSYTAAPNGGLQLAAGAFSVLTASTARITVGSSGIDLASGVVTAGTYRSVTVDTYGRVTGGTNPTTLAGYGITDAQSLDATLTALAGLTTAANQVIYATGVDTFAMSSLTAFGRSLIDDADAATARATLGLGTMATQNASAVTITGGTIDGITFDGGTF
jgi:hypothetical protein